MALFAYQARDEQGARVEGEIEADSVAGAASEILAGGLTPVRVLPAKTRSAGRVLTWSHRREIEPEELQLFCRHMHRLARAGVPLVRAIRGLAESRGERPFGQVLRDVAEGLGAGRFLSDALLAHPRVFSPLFVSVVRVGEHTGRLDLCFEQLAQFLAFERETRRRVTAALRYPVFVVASVAGALVLLNLFVLPAFAQLFAGFGASLPLPTRLLLATSDLFVRFWPHALVLGAAVVLAARLALERPRGRIAWDRLKLRLPLIGSILKRTTLARFARSFSLTYGAGVPVLGALELVARAVQNEWVTERLLTMRAHVEHGAALTQAAAATGIFEPLELQVLAVGEESGSLAELTREIAAGYESDVDYDIQRLAEAMEPAIMLLLGGVVLVLALGVYLPMWDLAAVARGGG